jgi:asparagine synthase (glutamine-hydrolysing)
MPRSRGARLETLRELLQRSVQRRLVSDVPLGAFLSGGVDSSLIVAMMTRELGRDVKTFSIGFAGTDESEHEHAREIAKLLGTDHHDEIIEIDAVHMADEIAGALDEPNGDSSCLPTYLLSRFARQQVTVVLSGDGGDELFGGYRRYTDTIADAANWNARLRTLLFRGRWWKPANGYLSPRLLIFGPDNLTRLMGGLPPAIDGVLDDWRRELNDPRLPLIHRMRNLDAATYLPGAVLAKVDRMSMQSSLEVRCPLLDRSVARFAEGLDAADCFRAPSTTKPLLRTLAERYLPAELMQRPKMGFGLPSNSWSRDDMLSLARDTVAAPGGELGNHVDRAALRALVDRLEQPGQFSIYQLWPLLILEFWLAHRTAASTQPGERLVGGL